MTDPDHHPDADLRPWERPGTVRRDCEPHRGRQLGALAGASLVCGVQSLCLVAPAFVGLLLGAVVIAAARRDLTKMRRGTMEPAGREATKRAQGFAFIGALLSATSLLVWGPILWWCVQECLRARANGVRVVF
jgi:hypothetical protein